tara:strand:- start:160 stop:420 length:261 start_codon:yes stop_codon:yes gene_type:complete
MMNTCIGCGQQQVRQLLDLGLQPSSNRFLYKKSSTEYRYPFEDSVNLVLRNETLKSRFSNGTEGDIERVQRFGDQFPFIPCLHFVE